MKRLFPTLLLIALPLFAAGPEVVATFEGKNITDAEVSDPIRDQLRQVADAEYNLKRGAIEQHVFKLVRDQLAKKEGLTEQELWKKEIEAKITLPTDAEIAATLRQYRQQLPADEAQAKEMVAGALRQQRIQERERAWRNELLASADFRILLEPVRYPMLTLPGDAASGPASAPVTIVEFSDFQCPYCASSQPLLDRIEREYGERVRIVFKHLPLDMHPEARFAAEASLCARDEGKFWEMHDWLFANPKSINLEKLKEVAPGLGLDAAKLESCVTEKRHAARVDEHLAQAAFLGVNSTPTFFVNGRKVNERTWETFSRLINEELPKPKPGS